jgi:hypothetical protein
MRKTGDSDMDDILFGAAGGLAAIWLAVHTFVGGRQIARPLVEAVELPPVVRHTQYLCWHFTTVAIACMAVFFLVAAITGIAAYATAATVLALGFFVVGVGLVLRSVNPTRAFRKDGCFYRSPGLAWRGSCHDEAQVQQG